MPLSNEWDEDSKKYLAEMIDIAVKNGMPIRAEPKIASLEYSLYLENLVYEIDFCKDAVSDSLVLIRQQDCNILWYIFGIEKLSLWPFANGDILRLSIDMVKFNEVYEQLLTIVAKVRISKIKITGTKISKFHSDKREYINESLQILVNKGNTIVEHSADYNLNFLESCNVSLE